MKKSEILGLVNVLDRKVTTINNAVASLQDRLGSLNVSDAAITMVKNAIRDIDKFKEEIKTMFRDGMSMHCDSVIKMEENLESWKATQEKNIQVALDGFRRELSTLKNGR